MPKLRVYIAGPYTQGDPVKNTARAIEVGDRVLELGHTPFIPHLNLLWDFHKPHEPQVWYDWDIEWLRVCDALIRMPGFSPGAEKEVELAYQSRIHVFYGIEEFECWVKNLYFQ